MSVLLEAFSVNYIIMLNLYLQNLYLLHAAMYTQLTRAYGGRGFMGFQETPFDSKTILKITCLNK